MRKNRKGLKLLAISMMAAMMATTLGSCGDSPSPSGSSGTDADGGSAAGSSSAAEPTIDDNAINIWLFAETHSNYFKWVTEEYTKANPETKFNIQVMDNAALQDRLTVIITAGGEGSPDFVDVEQGQFPNYMNDDKMCFEPLNDYIEQDGILDKMVEARLSLYKYKDTYYGLEHALCPVTMAYRPDLFEDNGITLPTTWDEYKAAADKLAEKGIAIAATGDLATGGAMDEISILLRAAGKDYVDSQGKLYLGDEIKGLMTDFRDMQKDGRIFVSQTDEDKWNHFAEDKVATYFVADWAAGWLRDNVPEQSGKWAMASLPKLTADASETSCQGGTGLAMMSYTKKDKDQLWEFMKYAQVDKDNCVKKYELINLYPPVYDAMPLCNKPVEYYNNQNLGELYQELSKEMPVQNQAGWRAQFTESLKSNAYDFCEGNTSIDDLCQILTDDVDNYISSQE